LYGLKPIIKMVDIIRVSANIYDIAKRNKKDVPIAMIAEYLLELDSTGLTKCKQCETVFSRKTKWQVFCCQGCKFDWHEVRYGKRFDPAKSFKGGGNGLEAIPTPEGILVRKRRKNK